MGGGGCHGRYIGVANPEGTSNEGDSSAAWFRNRRMDYRETQSGRRSVGGMAPSIMLQSHILR